MPAQEFAISPASLFVERPDGTVLVMTTDDDRVAFEIDGVAAKVWMALTRNEEFEQIRRRVLERDRRHEPELNQLISRLLELGLLQEKRQAHGSRSPVRSAAQAARD